MPGLFRRRVAPELREELRREPNWMYPWELPDDLSPKLLNPELASVHTSRAEMIEPVVRAALAQSADRSAIDLACSEGWFAHRLLDWGASSVLGLDIRAQNIHRATLIRQHFKIPSASLTFRQTNVYDLPLPAGEQFDVVLLLGLVYHVEDPVGIFRRARSLTRGVALIESQLTRQLDPIVHGWGTTESAEEAPGSFATRVEADADLNPVASANGVLSLIPNRTALQQMADVAGFSHTEFATPSPHHNPQYLRGDRCVMFAWP
jgi:tRNA (mo5U34)-methyltransferase